MIPTRIPRIPTLIPHFPIIPLIRFPNSPFWIFLDKALPATFSKT